MQQHAKGNRPQACRELTITEEDQLFQLGLFGKHEPKVLQRTVWWVLSLHFGFRARDESRRLKWGDIVLSNDPETGCELLLWKAERGSKTRHGDGQYQRALFPTAQATENERCPVQLYRAELGKNEIGKFLSNAAKAEKLPGNILIRLLCLGQFHPPG